MNIATRQQYSQWPVSRNSHRLGVYFCGHVKFTHPHSSKVGIELEQILKDHDKKF